MSLDGADVATVQEAIHAGEPLPGTAGFAGRCDSLLVRDVLGRRPLFIEGKLVSDTDEGGREIDVTDAKDSTWTLSDFSDIEMGRDWDFDHRPLDSPVRFPAGHVVDTESTANPQQCWSLPEVEPESDTDRAVADVQAAIASVLDRVDDTNLAIAFSGGVDSALLAAHLDGPLYVAGFPESHDIDAARSGAALLEAEGRDPDLRLVELDHETLEQAIPTVAAAIGRTNAMDVSIALPLFLLAEQISADGFDHIALGQGADELFGGYAKVANAPEDHRVEARTVRGARREMLETLPAQFERDVLTIRAAEVEPVTPLAHDHVVTEALPLGDEALVRGTTRKWALREAASKWLPGELCSRDKKALQYGSLVSRELDRLARQAGFKRRMDNHVQRYIESLV